MLGRRVSLPKCLSGGGGAGGGGVAASAPPQSPSQPGPPSRRNSMDRGAGSSGGATTTDNADGGGGDCAIRVVIRVRPLSEKELLARSPVIVNVAKNNVQVVNPTVFATPAFLEAVGPGGTSMALTARALAAATSAGECRTFHFDRCFGVDNAAANDGEPFANVYDIDVTTQRPNQELVFEEIGREIIPAAFEGFNCTVLAYGQTGSGKTHTMVGEKTTKGKGVIPRVCEALFQGIETRRASEIQTTDDLEVATTASASAVSAKKTVYTVQMSYCEIYKEKVHDLLEASGGPMPPSPSSSFSAASAFTAASPIDAGAQNRGRSLKVREHPITGPFVEGLSTRLVNSYDEISEEMIAGDKLRTVAATLMNANSSRSHAVFTIALTQTTVDSITQLPSVKTSKISMIDLAGSERANVSGTTGDRLKEGAMINKSLTTLGRVISALSKNTGERVPYRDSTLTWLLKESLGGNAKTTMIAMVSPAADNYDETMSTLRYAESAKRVMNRAVVNEDPSARVIRQLRDEVAQLKAQLLQRESEAFYLVENLKDNTELPPTVQDRDEFYHHMKSEIDAQKTQLDLLRQQQKDEQERRQRAGRIVRLHPEYPSLVNLKLSRGSFEAQLSLRDDDVLVFCLGLGMSVVGSEEASSVEVSDLPQMLASPSSNTKSSPRRITRNTSWAGSFLKRRKSSSAGSAVDIDVDANDSRPTSPRKNQAQFGTLTDSLTQLELLTTYLRLPRREESQTSDILPKHAAFYVHEKVSSRTVDDDNGVQVHQEPTSYIIDLQPLDKEAIVKVNEEPVSADAKARVSHGDTIQFGNSLRFQLYVPCAARSVQIESSKSGKPTEAKDGSQSSSLAHLIEEANAICTKWDLRMEFALPTAMLPSADDNGTKGDATLDANDDQERELNKICHPAEKVMVKKRIGNHRSSVIHWSRSMFEAKVEFLRQFAASFEAPDAVMPILAEETEEENGQEHDDDVATLPAMMESKLNLVRDADRTTEREESHDDDSRSSHNTRAIPASMSVDALYSTTIEPLQATSPLAIRLLGHARVYLSGLPSYKNWDRSSSEVREAPLVAAVYDSHGQQFAHIYCTIRTEPEPVASDLKKPEAPSTLRRGLSFLGHRPQNPAPTDASLSKPFTKRMVRIHISLGRIEFLRFACLSEQISLTIKKWGDSRADTDSSQSAESTPRVRCGQSRDDGVTRFDVNYVYQATTTVIDTGEVSHSDDYVAIEIWGYGEFLQPQQQVFTTPIGLPRDDQKLEIFVSVDVEEREADGFFRPVAVKNDGTLRLHVNQPRRVNLRITQADQRPSILKDICLVQLSPSLQARGASNLRLGDGKVSQTLLFTSASSSLRTAATTDLEQLPVFKTWQRLFTRSPVEMDPSGRSLTASLRWEKSPDQTCEENDAEDSRSIFCIVVAFRTTLSRSPIVISKSIITKLCPSNVTSSQRLVREWESSRTAWWARESFSRTYRLGTWYTVEIVRAESISYACEQERDHTVGEGQASLEGGNGEIGDDTVHIPSAMEASVSAHINGLRRLELVMAMERIRQEILIRHLHSRLTDEYPLTLERAQECFEELLSQNNEVEQLQPVIKVLQLEESGLYLRHKANKELFVEVESGLVVDYIEGTGAPSDRRSWLSAPEHCAHFVSEPTQLCGEGANGEMCGFLMHSTTVQLDENATSTVSIATMNPLTRALNTLNNKLSWERRWFVLKRPFLYAYKSFARKEQIGVLDISKCQLAVSPGVSGSSGGRRTSLPGLSKTSTSSSSGVLPFSFQLVSLAGSKCIVWSLQASTAAELRAWVVAIDPLRIEAREAVVSGNGSNGANSSIDNVALSA